MREEEEEGKGKDGKDWKGVTFRESEMCESDSEKEIPKRKPRMKRAIVDVDGNENKPVAKKSKPTGTAKGRGRSMGSTRGPPRSQERQLPVSLEL